MFDRLIAQAASLAMRITQSFDAMRMLVFACFAAVSDTVMRVKACDVPSLLSLHYSGEAEGPSNPQYTRHAARHMGALRCVRHHCQTLKAVRSTYKTSRLTDTAVWLAGQ